MTAVWTLSAWSCRVPDPEPTPYEGGTYIVNAGDASNSGSISFLPRNSSTVAPDIFRAANPDRTQGLQGSVQDYTEIDGKGVILVNNNPSGQDRIEIVEAGTFKSLTTLRAPDVENPRRIVNVGPNTAYVTCWDVVGPDALMSSGYILVLDLASRTVVRKIPVMKAPERMVVVGDELFVGSAGNRGDNTLIVIDLITNEVKQSINFGSIPEPIAADASGRLWILSGRDMVKFNPKSRVTETRLTLSAAPSSVVLGTDRQTFYYTTSSATYRFMSSDQAVQSIPLIRRSFTGLAVDPQAGTIYGGVTPSSRQAGYVLRYRPTGASAALIDSVKAETAPSGFFFR